MRKGILLAIVRLTLTAAFDPTRTSLLPWWISLQDTQQGELQAFFDQDWLNSLQTDQQLDFFYVAFNLTESLTTDLSLGPPSLRLAFVTSISHGSSGSSRIVPQNLDPCLERAASIQMDVVQGTSVSTTDANVLASVVALQLMEVRTNEPQS